MGRSANRFLGQRPVTECFVERTPLRALGRELTLAELRARGDRRWVPDSKQARERQSILSGVAWYRRAHAQRP